jgi:predicted enzyme related to lactoylglutathione lyase
MTFTRVIAQANVSELDRAESWYSTLFHRQPDTRPMDGLVEWRLGDAMGVQVWVDPERAGSSSMVLDATDLDALAARLDRAGVTHPGVQSVTASRILQLEDPDGNTVVVTGD